MEKARRPKGLSTVHIAQSIDDDVANGMDIWDCVTEILFLLAHEETDPVASFPEISGLASIPADDERESGQRPTVSAGFDVTDVQKVRAAPNGPSIRHRLICLVFRRATDGERG
jgi:hypothetical protein